MLLSFLALFSLTLFADKDTLPLKKVPAQKPTENASREDKVPAPIPEKLNSENGPALPFVASIDVYGTKRLNEESLKKEFGDDLSQWLKKGLEGSDKSTELEKRLANKIKSKYGFHDCNWSIIQFFEPGDFGFHITLDVVEKEDAEHRMDFLAEPNENIADPDGLIAKWIEYENTAVELVQKGEVQPESEKCKAFHCPFGHKHAKLKPYESVFTDGVKKHGKTIADILAKDKNPEKRAAAAFLLAYMSDGLGLSKTLVERVRDPDALVRNNVLRVLGDIAELHQEILIPLKPVAKALDYPRVTDRSKAAFVVYALSLNSPAVREELLKSHVPTLLEFIKSKQPDHYEVGHAILRKISSKEYAIDDIRAWTAWASKISKERSISRKN